MASPQNSIQIRKNNIRILLDTIKQQGPISKRDLQSITKLSWGAVSLLTGTLVEKGFIVPMGKKITSAGRRPFELDINPDNGFIVGVDLNLSGLCGIVTDLKGRIVSETRRYFVYKDYDCVINTLFLLLDEIFNNYDDREILGIGLAVQGFIDYDKGISISLGHMKNWNNVPLRDIVKKRYGCCAFMMHDPNCIMEAQKADLDSPIYSEANAAIIRLDNGIGMTMMINNKLVIGANNRFGEFGHIIVEPRGALCECGNNGCLSEYASGSGMVRRFVEQVNLGRETSIDNSSLSQLTCAEIAKAARSGDKLSKEMFTQMGNYLGLGIANIFNLLDPGSIVIYGEMVEYKELFSEVMIRKAKNSIMTGVDCRIFFSRLNTSAAAHGAALIASREIVKNLDIDVEDNNIIKGNQI